METISDQKCPKCKSEKIKDTGNKTNNGGDMGVGGAYEVPVIPIYKCDECGETFAIQ